jgi:hypothetical protein
MAASARFTASSSAASVVVGTSGMTPVPSRLPWVIGLIDSANGIRMPLQA